MNPDRGPQLKPITYPKNPGESLSETHYFDVMQNILETIGPDTPLYKMADSLCVQLGIPNGHTSALTTSINPKTGKRERSPTDVENDRIIGTVFANIPGVYVGIGKNKLKENAPVSTMDINKILDVLEKGQPGLEIKFQEFINALPEKDRSIILGERKLREKKKKEFEKNDNMKKTNYPLIYSRLPWGIGVFMRGYLHNRVWEKNFCTELIDIYADNSSIVLIEGYANSSIGKSLLIMWEDSSTDYSVLMRGIASKDNKILFGEIDGRNQDKIEMDNTKYSLNLPNLPTEFYENYYAYIKKINPDFLKHIEDPETLKIILGLQSTSVRGTFSRKPVIKDLAINTEFSSYPSINIESELSSHMTGLELGQKAYSDALSCVKLHLLAKLSADGQLPNGNIVDFQGAAHLDGKTFFIQNPQYALMVVLMNLHELMAGQAKKSWYEYFERNSKIVVQYSRKIFSNPDWEIVIKEILKLPIMSVEQDSQKTTELGLNQKKLIDQSPDYAKIYALDIEQMAKTLQEKFN